MGHSIILYKCKEAFLENHINVREDARIRQKSPITDSQQ
jgi:hypothetical protein